jgi:hypothetical protein
MHVQNVTAFQDSNTLTAKKKKLLASSHFASINTKLWKLAVRPPWENSMKLVPLSRLGGCVFCCRSSLSKLSQYQKFCVPWSKTRRRETSKTYFNLLTYLRHEPVHSHPKILFTYAEKVQFFVTRVCCQPLGICMRTDMWNDPVL